MAKEATIGNVRGLIRQRAIEAAAWIKLDEDMGEATDLGRLIASRQVELDQINRSIAEANASLNGIRELDNQRTAAARAEGEKIVAEANALRAKAEETSAQASAALENASARGAALVNEAKAQAAAIVGEAKAEAERINRAIGEIRRVA